MSQQLTAREAKEQLWAELDAGGVATQVAADTKRDEATQQQNAAQTDAVVAAVEAKDHQNQSGAADKAATDDGAGDKAADPYAGLPDAVRHEVTGLKAMVAQMQDRLRNAEGHIGGLKSQAKRTAQTPASADQAAPSASEIRAAQGDSKKMAAMLESYPEFGAAMKEALDERVDQITATLRQAQPGLPQNVVTKEQLDAMRREMLVESTHPGWQERVAQPAFQGWLMSQPREVQMLAASDSPQDAIRLLDLHTTATDPKAGQQRQQRLNSAAVIPTGRGTSTVRAKPVEQMSKDEYWRYLDEIDRQGARA